MQGQGSIEYLIVIGGAILAVAIIIAALSATPEVTISSAARALASAHCTAQAHADCAKQDINAHGTMFICYFDYTEDRCMPKPVDIFLDECGNPSGGWQAGKVYLLTQEVSVVGGACFNIDGSPAHDLTLNCGGHKITVTGASSYGIILHRYNNSIQNCIIDGGDYGIAFSSSGEGRNNQILYNTIENFSMFAINIGGTVGTSASYNRIEGNIINSSSGTGIYLSSGIREYNIIKNNTIFCGERGANSIYIPDKAQSTESEGNTCPPGTCQETHSSHVICDLANNCHLGC
ncbi:right-handed parallel beta-helix repeat-containing protein [Candidatus Micrarchaeota archaeon]|nr:right-handed parallel beta-helix repeat-containing protein [Candidatus Micrarchaeota archaeon]MBU1930004.1 right-handed parallel beta-helix repeat-containing protein [Candidatus Micrarchaeota archaeon]